MKNRCVWSALGTNAFTSTTEGGGDEEPGNKENLQLFTMFLSLLTFFVFFSLEKKEFSLKRGNEDGVQRLEVPDGVRMSATASTVGP